MNKKCINTLPCRVFGLIRLFSTALAPSPTLIAAKHKDSKFKLSQSTTRSPEGYETESELDFYSTDSVMTLESFTGKYTSQSKNHLSYVFTERQNHCAFVESDSRRPLSLEQDQLVQQMMQGENIFFTGKMFSSLFQEKLARVNPRSSKNSFLESKPPA